MINANQKLRLDMLCFHEAVHSQSLLGLSSSSRAALKQSLVEEV